MNTLKNLLVFQNLPSPTYRTTYNEMNSLHAVSASKNNNTERAMHPVSAQRVKVHTIVERDA